MPVGVAAQIAPIRARLVELRALPRLAKIGVVVIAVGVLVDAFVHSLGVVAAGSLAAFVVQQHLAHLVVLVGMVITLVGIVADGVRVSGRLDRPERRDSRAVR